MVSSLKRGNLEDHTENVIGTMIGIVPATRQFELGQTGELPIHGRAGPEIRDSYDIAERFNNRRVMAQVRLVRVGAGAPRYVLLGVAEPPDAATD